jgi:ABC-type spermidine/putrescine transport system permease subunit II
MNELLSETTINAFFEFFEVGLLAALVAGIASLLACWCRRRRRAFYQQILPGDDLLFQEEGG